MPLIQFKSCAGNLSKRQDFIATIFSNQDQKRIHDLSYKGFNDDKFELKKRFHKILNQPMQNVCQITKSIGGKWLDKCGFLDGEKHVCMDMLFDSLENGTCLVYSFGLGDNWDFEIFMANLGKYCFLKSFNWHLTFSFSVGCIVHAFDPSDHTSRPKQSLIPNLHFHNVGIWFVNGKDQAWTLKTLATVLEENDHSLNEITYLKMDVESSELLCFEDWFKSGIFTKVQQFGIEFHLDPLIIKQNFNHWYKTLIRYLQTLSTDYGLQVVSASPNTCVGKSYDVQKTDYAYIDVLMVKSKK